VHGAPTLDRALAPSPLRPVHGPPPWHSRGIRSACVPACRGLI
jgi:hypothetical protein